MNPPQHIWLLGLSGSGKSTLAPLLAAQLHLPFADTDQLITQSSGRTIVDIFQDEGEEFFRQLESRVLQEVSTHSPSIISCGGGIILDPANRQIMSRTGLRVYLQVPLPILESRLALATDRPLLPPDQRANLLSQQLTQRGKWYAESEICLDAQNSTPEEMVKQILAQLPSS
ncbi:MAG: shikimate kinase [Verrucomicrobiota bacterium]